MLVDTLDDALSFTGLDQVKVLTQPRLLSDNGPCYISGELAEYLEDNDMTHTRGRPYHPQTQGKIERWHRNHEKPDSAEQLLSARRVTGTSSSIRQLLQPRTLS